MVGAISHVSDRKEQMELRMDAEKSWKSSQLKVETPVIAGSPA